MECYDLVSAVPPRKSSIIGAFKDGCGGVHEGINHGTRSAEGESILEFGAAKDLSVCTVLLSRVENHLVMYASGNFQITYVMVRRGN